MSSPYFDAYTESVLHALREKLGNRTGRVTHHASPFWACLRNYWFSWNRAEIGAHLSDTLRKITVSLNEDPEREYFVEAIPGVWSVYYTVDAKNRPSVNQTQYPIW